MFYYDIIPDKFIFSIQRCFTMIPYQTDLYSIYTEMFYYDTIPDRLIFTIQRCFTMISYQTDLYSLYRDVLL